MHICSQGPLRPFWSQLCLIRLALSLLVTTSRKTFTSKGTKLEAGHKYFDSQGFSTERRTPSLEIFYFIKKICIYVYTWMMLMQFTTILVHQNWSHMLVSFALKITLRFEGKYLYHILYFCLFVFFSGLSTTMSKKITSHSSISSPPYKCFVVVWAVPSNFAWYCYEAFS